MTEKTNNGHIEGEEANGYTVVPFKGGTYEEGGLSPDDIRELRYTLYISCWEFLHPSWLELEAERIEKEVRSPETTGVLLRDKFGIVGFASFSPLPEEIKEELPAEVDTTEITDRLAGVNWTIIQPEHRGKGGLQLLMDAMDKQLIADTRFDYVYAQIRTENAFAQRMRKRYESHIIAERDYNDMILGPQKQYVFRIPR
jgi:hypothetical protein